MTNPPPAERRPARNRDLGFDEAIAMLIAFGAVGAILWWGLNQKEAALTPDGQPTPALGTKAPDNAASPQVTAPQGNVSQDSGIPSATVDQAERSPSPAPNLSGAPAVLPGIVPVPNPAVNSPGVNPAAIVPPAALVVPAVKSTAVEFPDVPAAYWAYPFITALAQRGILTGFSDGSFRPDEPVSRSQYAALIETIFKSEAGQNPIAFKDVPENFWAIPAIDTAVKAGFLKGYPEGTFQPDQPISRMQVLASLVNGLKVAQPATPADVVKRYQDNAQIPAWAVPAAAAATQSGMVVNYPTQDTLNPNQPITRAEISAVVYQALVAAGKLDPIASDYIVRP